MAYNLLKMSLIFVVLPRTEAVTSRTTLLLNSSVTPTISPSTTMSTRWANGNSCSSNCTATSTATISPIEPTTRVTSTLETDKQISKPSRDAKPTLTSLKYASSVSPTPRKTDDDSEPKVSLYIWQIVACAAGAFVFFLFIIIGLLCYQNRKQRKKLTSLRNYSLPIKENGVWINNQDIPLWQKRASIYNVQENPAAQETESS